MQELMQLHGIKTRSKRKYKATIDSNHGLPAAELRTCCSATSRGPRRIACGTATSPISPRGPEQPRTA